jgi:hypothetical protein
MIISQESADRGNTTKMPESGSDSDRSITIPSQPHTYLCDTKTPLLLGPSAFPQGFKFHCEVHNEAAGEMTPYHINDDY